MNTDIIRTFMSRVKGMTASKQTELKLSSSEAQQLAAAVGELMANRIDSLEKADSTIEVQIQGGRLK